MLWHLYDLAMVGSRQTIEGQISNLPLRMIVASSRRDNGPDIRAASVVISPTDRPPPQKLSSWAVPRPGSQLCTLRSAISQPHPSVAAAPRSTLRARGPKRPQDDNIRCPCSQCQTRKRPGFPGRLRGYQSLAVLELLDFYPCVFLYVVEDAAVVFFAVALLDE